MMLQRFRHDGDGGTIGYTLKTFRYFVAVRRVSRAHPGPLKRARGVQPYHTITDTHGGRHGTV